MPRRLTKSAASGGAPLRGSAYRIGQWIHVRINTKKPTKLILTPEEWESFRTASIQWTTFGAFDGK